MIGSFNGIEHKTNAASHWQRLSHNVASSAPRHEQDLEFTTLVVKGTDFMCSCKSQLS